jgi:hypothetical protein
VNGKTTPLFVLARTTVRSCRDRHRVGRLGSRLQLHTDDARTPGTPFRCALPFADGEEATLQRLDSATTARVDALVFWRPDGSRQPGSTTARARNARQFDRASSPFNVRREGNFN